MKLTSAVIITYASLLIAVVAVSVAAYSYYQYTTTRQLIQSNSSPSQELSVLLQTIGKFMELPPSDDATLATVSDFTKLGDAAFFSKAKNGDKVIIFSNAAKAILYRPSVKKVIEVAVFNPQAQNKVTNTSAPSEAKELVLTVLNGTNSAGATSLYKKEIIKNMPDVQILATEVANRRDYMDTMIIDISKKQTQKVEALAKLLDIAIGQLPNEDVATGSDALIIIGSDRAK